MPAHKFLFNCIDKAIGHYRRYTKKEIISKIQQTPFELVKLFYFNFAAIPGWYINGNIFKKSVINENAMGLFNVIVPLLEFVEHHIFCRRLGISLIAVLSRPE